jgi:tetratricopeptide (TPR) repeat protein
MSNTRPGRNDPCPCGSGKKYKQCCAQIETAQALGKSAAAAALAESNQLLLLLRERRYAEMEHLARAIVERQPAHGPAWKALAVSLQMQSKEALPAARRAAEQLPSDPETHYNLGVALLGAKRPEEALTSFRHALRLAPGYVPAESALCSTLHGLGRIAEAATCYQQLLDRNPSYAEMHSNLAHALRQLGRPEEAAASCLRALKLNPRLAEAHSNLGNALSDLERNPEAETCYRQALALKPDLLQAQISLANLLRGLRRPQEALDLYGRMAHSHPGLAIAHVGMARALFDLRRLDEAAGQFRRALEIAPQMAEVHDNLGHVLRELRLPREAMESCQRALQLDPGLAAAHSNLGNALLDLGRAEEAEAAYRRALAIDPARAEVHSNLAKVLLEMGRLEESEASSRRALLLDPKLAAAHENLGNALLNVNFDEAVGHYRRALEANPDDAELNNNLGIALRLMGRTAEAEVSSRRALELAPGFAPAIAALAEVRADRGEFGEAEDLFKQALALAPEQSDAWVGLSRLRKFNSGDASWLEQAERLANQSSRPREVAALRYAIGKYFDDMGEYDRAFSSYQRANELAKQHGRAYDRAQLTRQVDALIACYDRPLVPVNHAVLSDRAVLIVGMPRSGTSLAEQILASHPDSFGAGELTFWHKASASVPISGEVDDGVIHQLGVDYERLLTDLSASASRVIDKMPTNFRELGLICRALPGARIIHMRRDPIDTCLSIYFQDFRASLAYTNDLDDLVHFYREYDRLMHHWRRVLRAGVMLEVPYEGLVEDQEGWTRRMLDFVGLSWDARCLDFHQTERSVVTASKWQVRQKINKSSVARWRHYESHIGPLLSLAGTPG